MAKNRRVGRFCESGEFQQFRGEHAEQGQKELDFSMVKGTIFHPPAAPAAGGFVLKGRAVHMQAIQPRGLRRPAAATYLGISPSHFDKQRALGEIPAPRIMFGVELYDRHDLDLLFDGKPTLSAANDNEAGAWAAHWQSCENQNM
jgi:hypothetical protein